GRAGGGGAWPRHRVSRWSRRRAGPAPSACRLNPSSRAERRPVAVAAAAERRRRTGWPARGPSATRPWSDAATALANSGSCVANGSVPAPSSVYRPRRINRYAGAASGANRPLGGRSGRGVLDGGDRGRGRADRTRKPERRRGHEKAGALVLAEPAGELGQVPKLAQMHPELEQAMLVQGQAHMLAGAPRLRREILDADVVGDQ